MAPMKLTDEAKAFHHAVYSVVRQVPFGKITSYGHIAYLIGKPQNSRQVGSSLKHYNEITRQLAADSPDLEYSSLPWWRVVGSSGKISPRGNTQGEIEQKKRLLDEGIEVNGMSIDIREWGWFPEDVDF